MNLTEIMRGKNIHELMHDDFESKEKGIERCQRVSDVFLQPIEECVRSCGTSLGLGMENDEIALIVSTIALIDKLIEQCTSGKPS